MTLNVKKPISPGGFPDLANVVPLAEPKPALHPSVRVKAYMIYKSAKK